MTNAPTERRPVDLEAEEWSALDEMVERITGNHPALLDAAERRMEQCRRNFDPEQHGPEFVPYAEERITKAVRDARSRLRMLRGVIGAGTALDEL